MTFDGYTFDPDRDHERLKAQLARVKRVMFDQDWHTLAEIARLTGDPEASVSSRIRDLRKRQHGRYYVESEYVSKGLWRYRLLLQPPLEGVG